MAQLSNDKLQRVLQTIAQEEGDSFTFDAAKIEAEAHFSSSLYTNLPVKLLTIFGGFLATLFFMGFLFTTGLYNSDVAMLVFGVAFIVASEVLNRLRDDLLLSSVSVSLNITGYLLFGIGVSELSNDTTLALTLATIAAAFILVSEGTVLVFLSVLVLNGSLMSLPYILRISDLIHVYVGLIATLLTYLSLHEAKLISQSIKLNKRYGPVRMGLVFSLVGVLILLSHQEFDADSVNHLWIATILLAGALLFVLRRIMQETGVTDVKTQTIVYACVCVMLAPTIATPSISGALLIVLSSCYIGHRVSFIVGLLALGYFIILYYYNLHLTLLAKSGILVLTGCLFLGGLYFLNRYISNHAK
ncbi:DUF4401 domain-containing protein [Pontibacter pudoricolor]|uniref:DUF4401 domain-containing protein n=1 Tax=Pontibacter pudoricolor TaxID=2694930 RepID=UPI001391BB3C|nr:DUF4401 domain-containing protein [Pontibacter pudoricolor]